MKREKIICCLLCLLLLAGCGRGENPYRVDTVVQIPVNPTEETQPETVPPTEPAPTERPPAPIVGKGNSGTSEPVQTQPAETDAGPSVPEQAVPETKPFTPDTDEILAALNEYRSASGLGALIASDTLSDIAAKRAEEAATLWAVTRPDGRDGVTILDDRGWTYTDAAQLLLHINGPDTSAAIAACWADSPQLLKGSFTVAGVGCYTCGGVTYVACLLTD